MVVTVTAYKIVIMRDSAEIMLKPESGRSVRLRFRADQESENVDTGTWLDADVEPSLFDNIVDVLRNEQPVRVEWTPQSFMLITPEWSPVGAHQPAPADEPGDVNFS
jgi:hypothetical protein